MVINIEIPWILWLLLGNVFFIGYAFKKRASSTKFYVMMRCIVFSLIVISMAGVSWLDQTEDSHTIFLVDCSDSTRNGADAVDYINAQLNEKKPEDYFEIIAFGEDVAIESLITNDTLNYQPHVLVDAGGSNLARAFEFAINRFDQGKNKRLVLLSDFNETSGDLMKSVSSMNTEGIEFKHYVIQSDAKGDVQLVGIQAPSTVKQGERFKMVVSLYANTATQGYLRLYSDDGIVAQKEIQLKSGLQHYVFEDVLDKQGGHTYRAEVEVAGDTVQANNQWHHLVDVEGPLSVLLLDPNDEGRDYATLLMGQGFSVTRLLEKEVAIPLSQLSGYDSLVLINASIEQLHSDLLNNLDLYVKELGGGLLVIGGDASYVVGGYENTVLETMLPLNMALKVDGESYDLAMMAVIDKSGSMESGEHGLSKMIMAKEAVVRVAETLSERDELGLIAFDGQPYEVFPLTKTAALDTIVEKVKTVTADGGTSILPALSKGLEALSQTTLKGKHLLLLSDGQGEQSGFAEVIARYPEVTISTIAIGEGADVDTMRRIALLGHGRFYQVTDYKKIPEIFTKETRLAMDEYIKEGSFVPQKVSGHPIIEGMNAYPLLSGYIGASIKPQAEWILSVEETPLLATWQYGLGRTMAWTSDVGSWASRYYESDQGVQLMTDMVADVARNDDGSGFQMSVSVNNNTLDITGLSEAIQDLKIDVLAPTGDVSTVAVSQFSDGYFEGEGLVSEEGFCVLRAVDRASQAVLYQSPIAINYSKEYNLSQRQNSLDAYQAVLHSTTLNEGNQVFTDIAQKTQTAKDFSQNLLLWALILFVFDVACRKLRFDPFRRIINRKATAKVQAENGENMVKGQTDEAPVTLPSTPKKGHAPDSDVIDTSRLLSQMRKRNS